MQLDDVILRYWRARARDLSPNTKADYSRTFDRFLTFLETHHLPVELERITSDHVDDYLNDLLELGLSNKTVLNQWIALSSLWTFAAAKFGVTHVLADGKVSRPALKRVQPEPYSQEEIERMIRACDHNAPWRNKPNTRSRRPDLLRLRDRAIIITLVDTGIRASELCGLRVRDYNQRRQNLHIAHGKGDKERDVPVGNVASEAIDDYILARQDQASGRRKRRQAIVITLGDDEPLFATVQNEELTRYELLNMIQACAARAGVKRANIHRFRHTFAINYLRRHPNVYTLQRVLGHASLDTVRIYLQLSQADIHEAHKIASVADAWRL